jgi:hypothetical protein
VAGIAAGIALICTLGGRTITAPEPIQSDKKITMKRVFAITVVAAVAFSAQAGAQSSTTATGTSRPLADIAKDEEARRKSARKAKKVYTNGSLKQDASAPSPDTAAADPSAAAGAPTTATPAAEPPAEEASGSAGAKDQKYWQNRIKLARDQVARSQMFADSLQTRINSLWTDFVNRDDPAQKSKLEQERNAALAELEKVKKELEQQTKAISAIEDEARRAGVPSGWLRPGA